MLGGLPVTSPDIYSLKVPPHLACLFLLCEQKELESGGSGCRPQVTEPSWCGDVTFPLILQCPGPSAPTGPSRQCASSGVWIPPLPPASPQGPWPPSASLFPLLPPSPVLLLRIYPIPGCWSPPYGVWQCLGFAEMWAPCAPSPPSGHYPSTPSFYKESWSSRKLEGDLTRSRAIKPSLCFLLNWTRFLGYV